MCLDAPPGIFTESCHLIFIKSVPALQAVLGIPGEFGFLKKNELFVGRVAMLGFAAELVGEVCAMPALLNTLPGIVEHAEPRKCCLIALKCGWLACVGTGGI